MTTANKITVARLLLIPVFVTLAAYYSRSIAQGAEEIGFRIAALAVYALASISDAVDGYIARHYNQRTPFGQVVDPLADKLLLLSGVITLSVTHWHVGLPIWFAALVIARDAVIVSGVLIIKYFTGTVKMGPKLSSKVCTFLQLSCVVWVLLDFRNPEHPPLGLSILIGAAALFTVISGAQYILEGIRQLKEGGHTSPPAGA
ncbi:MAG: CDP-alcohol phosphatidyltransferase family protein [Verrucomicrobiales bacterium]|nr:CDP-alcohol phosphatidyltransferase family protein [Verrucomicrobiales bacterium]